MRFRLAAATCALSFGGALMVAGAAPASAKVCDAYSRVCPSTPPTVVGGGEVAPATAPSPAPVLGRTTTPGTTLPFTGGQFVLLLTLGGAAIVGGSALVVAGIRRNQPSA